MTARQRQAACGVALAELARPQHVYQTRGGVFSLQFSTAKWFDLDLRRIAALPAPSPEAFFLPTAFVDAFARHGARHAGGYACSQKFTFRFSRKCGAGFGAVYVEADADIFGWYGTSSQRRFCAAFFMAENFYAKRAHILHRSLYGDVYGPWIADYPPTRGRSRCPRYRKPSATNWSASSSSSSPNGCSRTTPPSTPNWPPTGARICRSMR